MSFSLRNQLIAFFILFYLPILGHCQSYKQLFIPYHYQIMDTWCWAASMSMVTNFHQPNSSSVLQQTDIINRYTHDMLKWNESMNCSCKNISVYVADEYNTDCSISMAFSSSSNFRVDYLDRIFSTFNYQSSQQINFPNAPISWARLKRQIDECRPFIAFIEPLVGTGISSDHAITIKGYHIIDTTKFLIANDPWSGETCEDRLNSNEEVELYIPYSNFNHNGDEFDTGVEKVWAIVGDIKPTVVYPTEADNCASCQVVSVAMHEIDPSITSCFTDQFSEVLLNIPRTSSRGNIGGNLDPSTEKFNTNNNFSSLLHKYSDIIPGLIKTNIKDSTLNSYLRQNNYFGSSVKYLSLDKINRCVLLHGSNKISKNVDHNEDVFEIVAGNLGSTVACTFQKNLKGEWVLRKVASQTHVKEQINVNVNGKTIKLSNNKLNRPTDENATYELIKVPPLHYEFFSFSYNNREYMCPVKDYNSLGVKADTAILEKKMMDILRKEVRPFVKQYKITLKHYKKVDFLPLYLYNTSQGKSNIQFSKTHK